VTKAQTTNGDSAETDSPVEILETDSPDMLLRTLISAGLLALVATAQTPGRVGGPFVPQPLFPELRQYLTLTDAQVNSLVQIQNNRREAEAAIYRQIAEKQQVLYGLLQAGSTDALQIGQLTVEINNLQRRLPLGPEPYRTSSLAVLNDPQKAKLPALSDALRLAGTAYQAVSLNLIDQPDPQIGLPRPVPIILPRPAMEATIVETDAQP
jgi:hypothetical protein